MDKTILVDDSIKQGKDLIEKLDKSGFPVSSTLWFYDQSSGTWKLIIATPKWDELGPHETYKQISKYVPENQGVSLKNVVALSPDNSLISLLRSAIRTDKNALSGIRLTNNTINNFFINDAYIYRLS